MKFYVINAVSIYRNINFDKNPDYKTETDLSLSDAISDDRTFKDKFKSKQAVFEVEYF